MRVRARHLAAPLLLALALAATACDTSLDPFAETDRRYSVFGYLDAAADTQWVRVDRLQDSIRPGPVAATVTTTNTASGETTVWNDSTFYINPGNVAVHNFWTTAEVQPEQSYRFTVERQSDGKTSTAEVTLPQAFPPLEVSRPPDLGNDNPPPSIVHVEGVERIGAVRADYFYEACIPNPVGPPNCFTRRSTAQHLADATRTGPASWSVEVKWFADIPTVDDAYLENFYSFHLHVASVSDDWPRRGASFFNPDSLQAPDSGTSNIENGVGFLGGAFVRSLDVPIENDST